MPLYEYYCKECETYYEEHASLKDFNKPIPCTCGSYAERIIASAPKLVSSSTWSAGPFHPHYDIQLGQHFNTHDERNKYLKTKGLIATEGPPSPEKANKSRLKMSESQALKLDKRGITKNRTTTKE